MRLSHFILENLEPILQAWEDFARTVENPALPLDSAGLRNHAELILRRVAQDMRTPQSVSEQTEKAQGRGPTSTDETAAQSHAITRLASGFSLNQMVSEYRALRSSVLSLWLKKHYAGQGHEVDDITRFNESIDQALVESIGAYDSATEATRKLFLGVLGHDLRTPLGAVMMGAELLLRSESLAPREKRISGQISSSVARANQIVNDLLDLARCNLGTGIPVCLEPADLCPLCGSVVNEIQASHPAAHIVFDEACQVRGQFDPGRMQQVFANLITNALQHGDPSKPVTVKLGVECGQVYFQVHNVGEPIPPAAMPYLFNPQGRYSTYAQTERGASAGLGLGLFIAEQIVTSHRGQIEVQSTLEAGTVFRVTIPLR